MCYMTLLSTTSLRDLAVFNTPLLQMSRVLPGRPEEVFLQYAQRWFVGSQYGCSCGFRHLTALELGFGVPEEWMPEDDCDIEATLALVAMLRSLIADGAQVDCIDSWAEDDTQADAELAGDMLEDLSGMADASFRLYSTHRFSFR